jgi:NAD+ synthase (glutamine-hydrolysing)
MDRSDVPHALTLPLNRSPRPPTGDHANPVEPSYTLSRMRLVRIALANVNATVGATTDNVDRALVLARQAAADDATVVVFPEQMVGGYPAEDLVQWRGFVDAQWRGLERFAAETASLGVVSAIGLTVARGSAVYNAAALVHAGKIHGLVPKEKLPLYNVFYEARTLTHGAPGLSGDVHGVPFGDLVFDLEFGCVALEICEDLWSPDGPMRRRAFAGAELVLNLSASPFRNGVVATRREIIATRASDNQATVAYANLVGENDGLVFDGGGVVSQNGREMLFAPRFSEGVHAITVDLDRTRRMRSENTTFRVDRSEPAGPAELAKHVGRVRVEAPTKRRDKLVYPFPTHASFFLPSPPAAPGTPGARSARADFCEDILDALTLGVGDYFDKTGAFSTIGVALSGGRDSLLCLLIARRAVDRKHAQLSKKERDLHAARTLRAFFMPTRYTSKETRLAAEMAAKELGVPLVTSDIDTAFERELEAVAAMLQPGEAVDGPTRQNVQARVRAERMWSWANSAKGLFLQTSNMSEKAVGYTTIGGDMEGALSVIANVPKTVVNYILDYLLETTGSEAIRLTLLKPPSAELADDMEDERDLMPFPVLDACFALYAGEKMDPTEVLTVLSAMFPEHPKERMASWTQKFARLFTQSIYKWVQAPLCLHVGNLDLERERALQLPVVQHRDWQKP